MSNDPDILLAAIDYAITQVDDGVEWLKKWRRGCHDRDHALRNWMMVRQMQTMLEERKNA